MTSTSRYLPPDITEAEMGQLDVDLDRTWHGVMGEVWAQPVGPVELGARRVLRSAALARVFVVSPSLILAWIAASAVVFALGAVVTTLTETPFIPLVAPALAAIGVSYAYGSGADVAYEISRTMPVSARMILLVRIAIVFGINTVLAGAASLITPVLMGVTLLWLLPMVAMSMLGLAIATVSGRPLLGGGTALLVWCAIVLRPVFEQRKQPLVSIDIGEVVSRSTLQHQLPLYLAVIAVCTVIVIWWNDGYARGQEDSSWQFR